MFDNTAKTFWIAFLTSFFVSVIVCLVMIVFIVPNVSFLQGNKTAADDKIEVPVFEGMDIDKAKLFAMNKSLAIFVEAERTSPTEEKGKIISQNPIAGAKMEKNSVINVIVSAGPEIVPQVEEAPVVEEKKITLPYYAGLNADEVKREIIKLKLKIGSVVYVENEKYGTDIVVKTEPDAGVTVSEGSAVNLFLSSGVKYVTVPSVQNLSKSSAITKLQNAGLKISEIRNVTDVEYNFDIIIKQSPEAGTKVKKGSGVTVWINTERE